jgi:rod shape-determining protein MreC
MLKSFNRNLSKILLATLLIACIGLLVYRNARRSSVGMRPKNFTLTIWLPVQKSVNWIITFPENTLNAIRELRYLRQEVNRLQLENQQYRLELSNYKSLENQLKRLESVLQLKSKFPRQAKMARIIAHDPSTWNKSFVIDLGSEDGVGVDSPVLSEQGIVGRVLQVMPRQSRVLLLTDASSSVAGIVSRSRVTGIVQGMGHSTLKYAYVDVREDVQKDDIIVSSGLGGIFPRGYVIGTISKRTISENNLNADIEVVPAVDFGAMDYVFVLPPVEGY